MIHPHTLVLLLFTLPSWPTTGLGQICDSIEVVAFLNGAWVSSAEHVLTRESWARVSPKTFEGSGEVMDRASGESRSAESLRIVEMSGQIFYVAKVDHNPLPVAFALSECSSGYVVFENAGHDFPKRIAYKRRGDDSLTVAVSDGAENGFSLHFGRAR